MRGRIGKIASVAGVAEVVDSRGQHRHLVAGDWLHEGDRLVTTAGSTVAMEITTGGILTFDGAQTVTLNAQLGGGYVASASDDAMQPWLLQQVLGALQSGAQGLDIASLLAALPQEATFAASQQADSQYQAALNIEDLIQDHADTNHSHASLAVTAAMDLMASTGLPSEVSLQQDLLKDFIKD